MNRIAIAIAALGLITSTAVNADTRMTFSTSQGEVSQFSIKGDRIRMEGGDEGNVVTLFDASSKRLTVIESSERSYYHMDAETMKRQSEQMSEQMQQIRKQMEEQMENMPEEQREMMREQMEQMMPEGAGQQEEPANLRIERRGRHASVAGIRCEKITVHADNKPIHQACVATADNLGMPRSDMSTLRSLFAMLDEMAVGFGGGSAARAPARVVNELGGVPIQAEDLEGGASWTLQDVRSDTVEASDFEIPGGYREVDPFSAGQGQ